MRYFVLQIQYVYGTYFLICLQGLLAVIKFLVCFGGLLCQPLSTLYSLFACWSWATMLRLSLLMSRYIISFAVKCEYAFLFLVLPSVPSPIRPHNRPCCCRFWQSWFELPFRWEIWRLNWWPQPVFSPQKVWFWDHLSLNWEKHVWFALLSEYEEWYTENKETKRLIHVKLVIIINENGIRIRWWVWWMG